MNIKEQVEIIRRFDNVLREINELRNELKDRRIRSKLVIKVSITELIEIGIIMKNKKNRRYSVLRNEWLNKMKNES
jgi:hypothetical protein